ncbi:hypothetical protein QA639_21475 [Bradyrhizobium pachyrhizi]|nr:hypothetical protein [Bradyrhizobium pachyrhizi]WFU52282.1 hypothetical protein QA639_21475 [Bradyrhizobium pachyrhizi]
MSRRRQLQIIRNRIHAELHDGLTMSIVVAFAILMSVDLVLRSVH